MRTSSKRIAIIASLLVAAATIASGGAVLAWRRVPAFYEQAVASDSYDQEEARDQFIARATTLAGDVRHSAHWQAVFTADQINGWLALELPVQFPDLLPAEARQPRIALAEGQLTIACRYDLGQATTVLSLAVEVSLHEPNLLAIRLHGARAGAVPLPLAGVLEAIARGAAELGLPLEWRKTHGDPVALVDLSQVGDGRVAIQSLEIKDGELLVAGAWAILPGSPGGRDDQPRVGSFPKETSHE